VAVRVTIEAVGPGATIQDGGRHGLLRYGVTPAGPMDWTALATANLALGNEPDAAAIEIAPGGIILTVDRATPLAFAGGGFAWTRGETHLPAAARIMLVPGERLRARAGAWGSFAICAVPGGVDIPAMMHSRSTHTRSALGGIEGRSLRAGDGFAAGAERGTMDCVAIAAPWLTRSDAPIRVVLGPQDDHFAAETIDAFTDATFTLSRVADRMAYRFEGPRLAHARDFNIVSDGVAFGAIQVAGDGQPLVLMADRQPTGGYAKIAHVCRADIGRLAQLRPGDTCRFRSVDVAAARDALLALEDAIAGTANHLEPLLRSPSAASLLDTNLIGGVVDGLED
jgi:biotin-dependent carboxylase-like uncharacterized protein